MFPMMPFGQNYGFGTSQRFDDLYPESYNIINPVVEEVVGRMDTNIASMPTQSDITRMEDVVYDRVDGQIVDDFEVQEDYEDTGSDTSQFRRFPRRRFRRRLLLRDFIRLLLLRQLFRRRGRFFF